MLTTKGPYRLQVALPPEVRDALRDIAHHERKSQQELVVEWLIEKCQQYPNGQHLETRRAAAPVGS